MGGIRPAAVVLCLAGLILFIALPELLFAGDIGSFRVEQAFVKLPNIKVYAGMPDPNSVDNKTGDNDTGKIQITGSLGTVQTTTAEILPFAQSGEGIGYVFLVDISESLKLPQFEHMREAISGLIGNMARKDMAAIITFGKDVRVVCDYTADKNELKTKINALKPTDNLTQLHRGLTRAVEMGRRKDASLPARKVIITLSDGEDDFAGGMTKDEVIDILKVDRIPIYAIGFYNPPATPKKDEHLKTLGEFARRSGGELIRANDLPLSEIYTILHNRIRNSYIINLACAGCTGDGQAYRLQLVLTEGTKQITDGMDVRVLPRARAARAPSAVPAPVPAASDAQGRAAQFTVYPVSAAIVLIVVLITVIVMRRRQRRQQQNNALPDRTDDTTMAQRPKEEHLRDEPQPPLPQRGIRFKFTVIGPARKTMAYEAVLDKPIVMGRNRAYCAVTIADDIEISGVHCEISRSGGKFYIKDLGSTNGTLVNGVSLMSVQKIDDGDTITLGQTELRVSIPAQADK
ncbi:MAG: VWA domain-containing protein [Nitrospirae bacterium]|nr:VWA domain-containing protein [Nitrospirota bacterium]